MPDSPDWMRPATGHSGGPGAPLIRVPASVRLRGHVNREVHLFLRENSMFRLGPGLPRDVFADERDFLPIRDPEWGLILVRRAALLLIEVSETEDPDRAAELQEEQGHRGEDVAVYLDDGTLLQGRTDPVNPERYARVQDLLNAEGSFLRLRREGRVQLVNKDCIVWVRPLTEEFGVGDPRREA